MSLPSSRANTWCRLKNEVVASTVFALSAPSLALASMLTQVTEFGSMPFALRQRRPHRARAVAGRIADLLAGEILEAVDAGALEPVEALRRIGVDVHQADEVEALAAEQQHARHVGQAELRGARRRPSAPRPPSRARSRNRRRGRPVCTSPFSARRNTARGRRRRPS